MVQSQPCASSIILVKQEDLPLCCPQPDERLWDGHPRVYLDLSMGEVRCPYCSTQYKLV